VLDSGLPTLELAIDYADVVRFFRTPWPFIAVLPIEVTGNYGRINVPASQYRLPNGLDDLKCGPVAEHQTLATVHSSCSGQWRWRAVASMG